MKKFLLICLLIIIRFYPALSFGIYLPKNEIFGNDIENFKIFIIKTENIEQIIKIVPLNLQDRIFLITPNDFILDYSQSIKIGNKKYFGKWVEIFINVSSLENQNLFLKIISYSKDYKELKVLQEKTIEIKINYQKNETTEKIISEEVTNKTENKQKDFNTILYIAIIVLIVLIVRKIFKTI